MNHIQNLLNALKTDRLNLFFELFLADVLVFLFRLIFFLLILYIGSRICRKVQEYIEKIPVIKNDLSSKHFATSFIKLGINLVFFFIGLIAFGFSESSVATMISAIGLGIGISLKEFFSNFAGGIVLFFSKPFKVGNFIKVNGVMGEVAKIEVFSTHINSLDSRRIIIPNNVMISGNIINYDTNKTRRIKLMLSVGYSSDMKKVMQVLNDVAATYEGLDKNHENFIHVMEYGDSGINILFMVWAETKNYYKIRGELMAYLVELFDKEGIDVPYNILDVNLRETNK